MQPEQERKLIELYKKNDENAQKILIEKYKDVIWYVIHHEIHTEYIINPDLDEMFQEGLIALDHAISSYDPEKGIPLFGLAKVCIRRRILSYVKSVTIRQTKLKTISLDSYVTEDEKLLLYDLIASQPENKQRLPEKLNHKLTEKELTVIQMRYAGYSYEEIAHHLKVGRKTVDNLLQRIKRKLKETSEE